MLNNAEAFKILGLNAGATREEVKLAFRKKALATHPDLNHGPSAAEEYAKIQKAADQILNGAQSRSKKFWNPRSSPGVGLDRFYRLPRFPLYFSAACMLGGCVIFYAALQAHHIIFDRYSYDVVEKAEARRQHPTPDQQRINALLLEKRLAKAEQEAEAGKPTQSR